MYLPDHFNQQDADEIAAYMHAFPLATVITMVDGQMWPTQIPLFLQGDVLIGHVARANQMWKHDGTTDVLVVFGGADTYITPNWYETKRLTHEVVPTWNYASVNIWGELTLHDDAKWKRMAVGKLTTIHERTNAEPWKMGDAPQEYLESQLGHIIGIEISINRLEAKWKLNQNRTLADREGVIAGLSNRGSQPDATIAEMMRTTITPDAE
ncbi:MAG: FMN-binding negative transcriptional regulator [Thermomicrobiales bacterium]|nr:FMN-binding negative transcriptional regulator [Thermomicrobiales bacterium]